MRLSTASLELQRTGRPPPQSGRRDSGPGGLLRFPGPGGCSLFVRWALALLMVLPAGGGPVRAHSPSSQPAGDDSTSAVIPNDELFERYQWNLRQIRAPEAWELSTGSPSVTIAVLDTGVSPTHPDLMRKLVPGYDFANEDPAPDDDHGNGTHVAGIAAADTNNRLGIAGIAWQARIMPVKVLDASARGDPVRVAQGVVWAADHGAQVINLGLAGPNPSQVLEAAIAYAYHRGVLVVAPVASNGTDEPSYPAASPHVLAVAATDRLDRRLPTSNTGAYISVAAPGEQIASTYRALGGIDGYAVAGTSAQAAAQVSGLAALLLAINPSLGPDELRLVLESSADDVGAPGRDVETGFGRINAARAMLFAAPWNFFPRGAGSYVAQTAPGTALYFPVAMKDVDGWSTSLTIQNASQRTTKITIEFVDAEGKPIYGFPATLPPMAAATYQPARLPSLPLGFLGGAVVRADGPIAGVANQDRPGGDRLTYEGFPFGASMVWIPLLMQGDWDSAFQVQNLGAESTSARVTFYGPDNSTPVSDASVLLPPLASNSLSPPSGEGTSAQWVGSAIVESLDHQPLAVVVNHVHGDGAGMSYGGVSWPASSIYAPLLRKNNHGRSTELLVQNAGAAATSVVALYTRTGGSGGLWSEELAAEAGGVTSFSQAANAELPDDFVGAGVVQSLDAAPLGGMVNEVDSERRMAMAYDASPGGAQTIFAPLVYREFAGWSSGLQVQNVGSAATVLTVTFYRENGSAVASVEDSVDPAASKSYFLEALDGVPRGFIGSVVAVSSNGQPIAAIIHHRK